MSTLLLTIAAVALAATPEPTVRSSTDAPRVAPHGKARVWALAEGDNAWVGRLELAPGAAVPKHRDPTEETIVVLSGFGKITIDGETTDIGPGDAVKMPAQAEVSYKNGTQWLIAVQVFAGPAPAAKYDAWQRAARTGQRPARTATVGPFLVTCHGSECDVRHGTTVVAEDIWSFHGPEAVLQPLGDIVGVHREAWLLSAYAGDGCPVVYSALCMVDDKPVRTKSFGNCEEPWSLSFEERRAVFRFREQGDPEEIGYRREETGTLDPWTCGLEVTSPELPPR